MLGIKSTSKEYVVKWQKDLAAYAGFLCQEKNKPQKQTRRGGRISELRIMSWTVNCCTPSYRTPNRGDQ